MLNGRIIVLSGIIHVIFLVSTTLGQIEPSLYEILNAVHKVDKDVAVLSEKMNGVESRLDQKID